MFQLLSVSGKMAGQVTLARHFPFSVGRDQGNQLVLTDPGVWQTHFTLRIEEDACWLMAASGAHVAINGTAATKSRLSAGDLIEIGEVKLRFGLSPTHARGLRTREAAIWGALAGVFLFQFWLIYRLLG